MRDLLKPSTRTELPKESNHRELVANDMTVDGDWCDLSHSFLPLDKHESAFDRNANRWSFMSLSEPGEYRTVSQVDFLTDCMAEEAMCIVHFYDENSSQHKAIDSVLEDMAKQFPDCKFYRMDSAKGLRISSRFKIKSTPTVLAIRDKKVLDRTSDFGDTSSFQATELRSWVTEFILRE
jgi:thioredoxin-like negative regulator of GroEL